MSASARIPAQPQDAFNDYARIVADQQLGIAIEFAARVDADRLAQAVRDLVAAQPVLGCRFRAAGRRAWHEPVETPCGVELFNSANPFEGALYAAGQRLAPDSAHLAVALVRGPESDALALRVDHTAADGQGVKACVELLAAAYSGTLAADRRAATTDRSWRRLRRCVGWGRLVSAAAKRKADPPPTWGVPRADGARGPRHHDLLTLTAEESSAVREWGKARGFTVNDLVLGAFYRAMFALVQPGADEPMVVRVSFDQRRYLDPADPMPAASNLSSIEPLRVPLITGEPFEDTVSRASAEMARLKASSPGLGSALLLEMVYRLRGYSATARQFMGGMERGQKAGRTYPFVSNFGVLDEARLGFGELRPTRVVVLPVAAHPPFVMLGASSYRGALTLSVGFAEGEVDPAVPKALLRSIGEDLRV